VQTANESFAAASGGMAAMRPLAELPWTFAFTVYHPDRFF